MPRIGILFSFFSLITPELVLECTSQTDTLQEGASALSVGYMEPKSCPAQEMDLCVL